VHRRIRVSELHESVTSRMSKNVTSFVNQTVPNFDNNIQNPGLIAAICFGGVMTVLWFLWVRGGMPTDHIMKMIDEEKKMLESGQLKNTLQSQVRLGSSLQRKDQTSEAIKQQIRDLDDRLRELCSEDNNDEQERSEADAAGVGNNHFKYETPSQIKLEIAALERKIQSHAGGMRM